MSFNKKQLKKDSPKKNAIDLKLKPIKKNPNYKYGFSQFQPGEGNLMLGAGFGNSKIGMGAMGMTPLDAENRKYFKGLVDANINYNVNPNLNFRLGVNDVIGGGFNPGINAGIKLKFGAGGGLLSKTMKCNSCGWSWKAVDGGNDIYNCHKCSGKALPQNFKEGGEYVDLELDKNDIEYYKNQGYLVEYLEGGANPNDPPKKSDDGAIHVTDPNDPDYLKYLEHNKLYRKLKDNLRAKEAKNAEGNLKRAKDWLDMVKNDWGETYDDLNDKEKKYYNEQQKVIAEKGIDKDFFSYSKWDVDKERNKGIKVVLSDEDKSYLEQAKALGLDIRFKGGTDSTFNNPIVPRPKQKYILDKATTHKDKIKNYKTGLEEYSKEAKAFEEYDKGYNQRKEDWKNNYNSYKEKLNKDWGEARGVEDWKVGLNNADGRGVDYLINQGFDIDDITWNDLHWVQQNIIKEGEGFNSSSSFIKPVLNKFTEKYTGINPTEPTKPKVTLPPGYSYRQDDTRDGDMNDYLKGNKRISREEFIEATGYAPTQFRERHIKTPKFKEGGLTEPEVDGGNIPPEQEAYQKKMKEGEPNMVHRDANWAAKIRSGLPVEYANYNDEQIRELYDKQNIVGAERYGDEMIPSYNFKKDVEIYSSGVEKKYPYWNQLPEHTKKTILDANKPTPPEIIAEYGYDPWSAKNNPMLRSALSTAKHGDGLINVNTGTRNKSYAEGVTDDIVKPGMALAALPLVMQAAPTVWAAANTNLLGLAGTSLMDAAGIYGAYEGGKALPGHVSEFAEDPSWKGAGKIGLDALGIAGGAYSAGKLLKNLPGAQFLGKTTAGSVGSGNLNSGFNPEKISRYTNRTNQSVDEFGQARNFTKDFNELPNYPAGTNYEEILSLAGKRANELDEFAKANPNWMPTKESFKYLGTNSERPFIQMNTPAGNQTFYRSSGLGNKAGTQGNWVPFEAYMPNGRQPNWFMKQGSRGNYQGQPMNTIFRPNRVTGKEESVDLATQLKEQGIDGIEALRSGKLKLDFPGYDFNYTANPESMIHSIANSGMLDDAYNAATAFKQYGGSTEPEYMYLDLDDDAIQQYKNGGWVVEDVEAIPKYPDGGTVSQMWEKETGTPWSEAKAQGLADGSYDSNMALRKRLAAGEFSNTPAVTPAITPPVAVPTNTPMELVPESVSVEPIIENNSNFEIPNEIVPSAKQVAALSNDKGAEGLASDPNFAKVYNPRTIKNPFEDKVPNDDAEYDIQNAASFSEAFGIARETYGPNYIFEYKGRSFGTNKKGEDFKPTNKVLKKHKLDTPEVKKRIEQETKEVESPFFSKETIKLEADGYESWEDAKLRKEEFNKQDNADKIIDYHKNAPSKENFVIVDKAKGLMHIYKPNGELLYSEAFDVNTGKNEGDNQTVTKPKDLDGDGRITNDGDKVNGKFQPDWSAGNKSTGAGKYYISNIDPTGYKGLPILNMMNEGQYDKFKETGQVDNVATSFHKGYISSDDTRRSNGCVRCTKPTLEALTTSLKNLSEVYILPDNDENKFVYENGQLNFRPKLDAGAPMTEDGLSYLNPKTGEKSNIPYYKDERGDWQKGQGVNKTNKTLNYIPIKVNTNKEALRSWGDKNMSGGYEDYGGLFVTTANDGNPKFENDIEPFTNSLAENKQKIMQVVGINGDVYNEIAQMTMGIYGAESSFGDTNNDGYNLMKAARKWWNPANSSPDYYSKYNDYGASDNDNSVGLTQYRWKWALEDAEKGGKELEILNAVGITKNSDFMDPEKAALGTAAILAYRYNTQLSPDQKKDMWNNLPGKWNTAGYYGDRVKEGAALFSISQMTEEANNERLSERDKINKRREEDALPANVQARHEASLKRKAELERIEAAKSPEQKAAEEKMRSYEYIPEADTRANNKPQFEQYPQIDLTRPRIRGQRDARSGEEQSTVRGSGSNARSVYTPTLQPTAGRPVSNLHLRNYRKYGGEIKAKDIFIEYLKRKKNI